MASKFRFVLVATLGAVALLAGSCGVAEPNAAATLNGHAIRASTVDTLANDDAFMALINLQSADSDVSIPGDTARSVLDFLLQGDALWQFGKDEGLGLEPSESALADTIENLKSRGYQYGMSDLSSEARDVLSRYAVASQAVAPGRTDFGDPTDKDLHFAFDQLGEEGFWERTCVTMVAGPAELGDEIVDAVESGTPLAKVPDEVTGTQLVVDAESQCASELDLGTLPEELSEAVADARPDDIVGPVKVSGTGQELSVVFTVSARETLDFEKARDELESLVRPSLLAVRTAQHTEVNPRYGGPMELQLVQGQPGPTGQPGPPLLAARVSRPQAPEPSPAGPLGS